MRTFKIIVITAVLILLAGIALAAIRSLIPSSPGPDQETFDEIYREGSEIEDSEDLYANQLKQYEGEVKVLGVSIYGEGTHRLEDDNKLIVILESDEVNLMDFEGQRVQVRGFVRDTVEGGQKIMDVKYLEVLEEAGVKAFNDVAYDFSFSYPADWEVEKRAQSVVFTEVRGDQETEVMRVYQYSDIDQSLEEWLDDRDQNLFYEESQVQVGGETGVRRTITDGDDEIVKTYVKNGSNAYEIRLVAQDEVLRNQYFSIVDFFNTSFVAETNDEESETEEAEAEESLETEEAMDAEEDDSAEEPAETEVMEEEGDESGGEEETSERYTELEPLSEADVQRVLDKGFSPFQGRTLSFDYPKVWYFSYIGEGIYGFTDDETYKASGEEIEQANSRLLIDSGESSLSCSYRQERQVGNISYTVCAQEPGLSEVVDHIADSLKEGSGD